MAVKFRMRWIPLLAAVIVSTIGMLLGNWQTRRGAEKEAIEARLVARQAEPPQTLGAARLSADDVEFRRIRVKGEFVPEWSIYLDNRPYNGMAGFYVLTPLKIAGSDMHVVVARGWTKRDLLDRTRLPEQILPAGLVEIEGIARRHAGQVLQLGAAESLRPNAIVQNIQVAGLADASGLAMQPFVLEQLTDTGDGLVRDWPKPSIGIDKHRGYAFQWYALAALAIVFFVVTGFRRGQSQAK